VVTAEGPIGGWAGTRRDWTPTRTRLRERTLAALRLLAFVLATSVAVATVVAVILAIVFQRFAAVGG
jgi:hypothetical protein